MSNAVSVNVFPLVTDCVDANEPTHNSFVRESSVNAQYAAVAVAFTAPSVIASMVIFLPETSPAPGPVNDGADLVPHLYVDCAWVKVVGSAVLSVMYRFSVFVEM